MAAPTFSKNLNMHRRPIQGSIIECEWKRGEGVAAAENVSEKRVHEIVSMVTVGHRAVKPVLRAPLRGFGLDGTMPNGFSSADVVNVSGNPLQQLPGSRRHVGLDKTGLLMEVARPQGAYFGRPPRLEVVVVTLISVASRRARNHG